MRGAVEVGREGEVVVPAPVPVFGGVEQSVGPTSQRHHVDLGHLVRWYGWAGRCWALKDRIFTFLFLLM